MRMDYTREAFLDDLRAFTVRTGWKPTNIGVATMGDRNFVQSVREGRFPRKETMEKVWAWMEQNDTVARS